MSPTRWSPTLAELNVCKYLAVGSRGLLHNSVRNASFVSIFWKVICLEP